MDDAHRLTPSTPCQLAVSRTLRFPVHGRMIHQDVGPAGPNADGRFEATNGIHLAHNGRHGHDVRRTVRRGRCQRLGGVGEATLAQIRDADPMSSACEARRGGKADAGSAVGADGNRAGGERGMERSGSCWKLHATYQPPPGVTTPTRPMQPLQDRPADRQVQPPGRGSPEWRPKRRPV